MSDVKLEAKTDRQFKRRDSDEQPEKKIQRDKHDRTNIQTEERERETVHVRRRA